VLQGLVALEEPGPVTGPGFERFYDNETTDTDKTTDADGLRSGDLCSGGRMASRRARLASRFSAHVRPAVEDASGDCEPGAAIVRRLPFGSDALAVVCKGSPGILAGATGRGAGAEGNELFHMVKSDTRHGDRDTGSCVLRRGVEANATREISVTVQVPARWTNRA